jgi:divalent metal cation (Fe/Co/Zn/Cd) transporter
VSTCGSTTPSSPCRSLSAYLRTPRDPTINSVLLEDSAAMVGLAIAAVGVGMHQITGSATWDGGAALAIGVLLLTVAFVLARACQSLLVGRQADRRMLQEIVEVLEEAE